MNDTAQSAIADFEGAHVRAKLDHPVIDTDGHFIEIEPILIDYIEKVGGAGLAQRYRDMVGDGRFWGWYQLSPEERRHRRVTRPPFWALPTTNSADRAAAMIPGFWRARMDEFGIDLTLAYPTICLMLMGIADDEMRRGFIRAANMMTAALYKGHEDRIIPAATIPTNTPEEAIEELDFIVNELGMKLAMVNGMVRRPVGGSQGDLRSMSAEENGTWVDPLGLDSEYDYDPFWAKCVEFGIAPTMHSHAIGLSHRTSISSYNYNHIGHFADASEATAKALFLGGVTRRFPELNVGFLECGVGWAVSLYHSLMEHWEKRNIASLTANLDPAKIDQQALVAYAEQYGNDLIADKIRETGTLDGPEYFIQPEDPKDLDEWAACAIKTKQDVHDLFVPCFYFGCEADDRGISWAFDTKVNALGARLNAMFSSDIGHWDVQDASEVLSESYELVERGVLGVDDFRDFTFTNTVHLHGKMNPQFFEGTAIEKEASAILNKPKAA